MILCAITHLTAAGSIRLVLQELLYLYNNGAMNTPMGDMPTTRERYKLFRAFRFVFEGGKIKSILSYWDTGSMFMQLGLIPAPALQN